MKRLGRILLIPALVFGFGLAGLSLSAPSAHAQTLVPAPMAYGGGMCVDGSYPTALGCTSGFAPNYAFGSSYFSPWYGNSLVAPGFNYGAPAMGAAAPIGPYGVTAYYPCTVGFVGYPCGS